MGFSKYANAPVVQSSINLAGWDQVRQLGVGIDSNFESRKASRVILQEYHPDKYLLSHCSIMASVDTESPKDAVLGVQMVEGVQIDRKYADYYITPETSKYVNSNFDSWERKLLLSSYKTFIGAENYLEHLQIKELSKGKIIDAAARDIGESVYIDILVATDLKHKPLIEAITSGQLSTLSMGASVQFTVCSKCGNVAEDELQLCGHIKYQKGNFFLDPMGKKRKIAELCGHLSAEPGSVKFIEASWVANPAFTGAVVRNLFDPADATAVGAQKKIQAAFEQPARTYDPSQIQKAATLLENTSPLKRVVLSDDLMALFDGPSLSYLKSSDLNSTTAKAEALRTARLAEIQAKTAQDQAEQEAADPLKKPADELYKTLLDRVVDRAKNDVAQDETDKVRSIMNENESNESLIKEALQRPEWKSRAALVAKVAGSNPTFARTLLAGLITFERGGWAAFAQTKKFTGKEILAVSRLVDQMVKKSSMAGEVRVYRTVLAVGGTAPYSNVDAYLTACRQVVGRDLTESETIQLVFKGKLYSMGR